MSVLQKIKEAKTKTILMKDLQEDLLFYGGFCERKVEKGAVERIMKEQRLALEEVQEMLTKPNSDIKLLYFLEAIRELYFNNIDRFTDPKKCDKLFIERLTEPMGFVEIDNDDKKQRAKLLKRDFLVSRKEKKQNSLRKKRHRTASNR